MKGFDDIKKIYEILSGIGLTVTDEQKKDFEKNFKEAYTPKTDFDRLTDIHGDQNCISNERCYEQGFRDGAKLKLDILTREGSE